MLDDPYSQMDDASHMNLISAESVELEFKNMLKLVPGVMVYFITVCDHMLKVDKPAWTLLSGRDVFGSMRARCQGFLGVDAFGIDNRFSQHFVREAIKRRPDLAPYFEQREYREKDFKVPNTFSRSWLPK